MAMTAVKGIATDMYETWVYSFTCGDPARRDLLGGKGAGRAAMIQAGLPVPPGFTITTTACLAYHSSGGQVPEGLWAEVWQALAVLESQRQHSFGLAANPLLVSVCSGAPISMPGMMDTGLNVGLNDETVIGLATSSGDARFAYDSYRRLMQMYGVVVLGIDSTRFADCLSTQGARVG
jgi:pyruvate, orthophosphate dikinase